MRLSQPDTIAIAALVNRQGIARPVKEPGLFRAGLCCKVGRHAAEWLDVGGSQTVSDFKGRHFEGEIVL